jgi:Ca2+-binding EF-hand superfamily protein
VTSSQIMTFIDEREYSVVSQSFMRFFDVIDKKERDFVSFDELLPALASFCLFTRSEILGFVFSMIDEDRDQFVSKADIFKQLMITKAGQRVNPPNITRSIELVYMTRGDQMDVNHFAELVGKIPFIIFPTVRLQETLREKFGGKRLWQRVSKLLIARQNQDKMEEQRDLFVKRKEL